MATSVCAEGSARDAEGGPCRCLFGYERPRRWDPELGVWRIGPCERTPCPSRAVAGKRPGVCRCRASFKGRLRWVAKPRPHFRGDCLPRDSWRCPVGTRYHVERPGASAGSCVQVRCPGHSARGADGLCACSIGYVGPLKWNASSARYVGVCTLSAECPPRSTRILAPTSWHSRFDGCVCDDGCVGAYSVGQGNESWRGNCSLVPCGGAMVRRAPAAACECELGRAGASWSRVLRNYTGDCLLLPAPRNVALDEVEMEVTSHTGLAIMVVVAFFWCIIFWLKGRSSLALDEEQGLLTGSSDDFDDASDKASARCSQREVSVKRNSQRAFAGGMAAVTSRMAMREESRLQSWQEATGKSTPRASEESHRASGALERPAAAPREATATTSNSQESERNRTSSHSSASREPAPLPREGTEMTGVSHTQESEPSRTTSGAMDRPVATPPDLVDVNEPGKLDAEGSEAKVSSGASARAADLADEAPGPPDAERSESQQAGGSERSAGSSRGSSRS